VSHVSVIADVRKAGPNIYEYATMSFTHSTSGNTTTVRIPTEDLDSIENSINRGMLILKALRDAGVPVVGSGIWPEGVERGTLSVKRDFFEVVYKWEDES
jgi:hypothetical protein